VIAGRGRQRIQLHLPDKHSSSSSNNSVTHAQPCASTDGVRWLALAEAPSRDRRRRCVVRRTWHMQLMPRNATHSPNMPASGTASTCRWRATGV
jgi:hypothetical protein